MGSYVKSAVYKTRLRNKGQVTIPVEVRGLLNLQKGDDIAFFVNEQGKIFVQRLQTIQPEQEWFWTERWQKMEQEAQADIEAGRVSRYENVDDAIGALEGI